MVEVVAISEAISDASLTDKRNVNYIVFVNFVSSVMCLNFICSCESGNTGCKYLGYDHETNKTLQANVSFQWKRASVYYLILASCSFSFKHTGPPSYLTVLEEKKISLK